MTDIDLNEPETLPEEIVHWQPAHKPQIDAPAAIATGASATGSALIGAVALGAVAIGAVAIGAVAVGAFRIGRLSVRNTRLDKVEIGDLLVRRLRVLSRK
jgi:hypothetical protein